MASTSVWLPARHLDLRQRPSEGLSAPLKPHPQPCSRFPTASCVQDPESLTTCLGPGHFFFLLNPSSIPSACLLVGPSWESCPPQQCGFQAWLSHSVAEGSRQAKGLVWATALHPKVGNGSCVPPNLLPPVTAANCLESTRLGQF